MRGCLIVLFFFCISGYDIVFLYYGVNIIWAGKRVPKFFDFMSLLEKDVFDEGFQELTVESNMVFIMFPS